MKTLIRLAAVALAVAVAAPVAAAQPQTQPSQPQNKPQIGVGAGITSIRATGVPDFGTLVFVPIQLGAGTSTVRVEPFLGWARADIDESNNTNPSFEPLFEGKTSDVMLGVGGFLVAPVAQQVQLYGGGRLGLEWQSAKSAAGKASRRNTFLALAGGAEYMPVPRVAFGAEIQVGYIWFGDTKFQPANAPTVENNGGTGSATQTTFFARFFVF